MQKLCMSLIIAFSMLTLGCASTNITQNTTSPYIEPARVTSAWVPLYNRLIQEGLDPYKVGLYFAQLPATPTQAPMGRKIQELYSINFKKKTDTPTTSTPSKSSRYSYPPKGYKAPGPWYKDIVTKATTQKCIDFIHKYSLAFDKAEREYQVPREIIAALLFIETRLGEYLGSQNAFYTLASMASSTRYEDIPDWIAKLPENSYQNKEWINAKMLQRSEWAYKEFKALVEHNIKNNLNPIEMPGSVYGAIGLCQFMPSNIVMYSADGNNDNSINLFDPEDAIVSVAKYLKMHSWNTRSSLDEQKKVLKRYNNLNIYANTILGLAESIRKSK